MFFLITGASGVGKSTVRRLVEAEFADRIDSAELATLGETPGWNVAWRHRMVERIVGLALRSQDEGRSFLLCGDPVPPGELVAAPSADQLNGIAVCLLDASADAQRDRLTARGDTLEFLSHHVAFADWMRRHAVDPAHMPEVVTQDAWPEMRWDRWLGTDAASVPWSAHIIDTTDLRPEEVAECVAAWIRRHL